MIPIPTLLPAECGCSSCAADSQPPKEVVTAGPELEEAPVLKEASEASQPSQADALTPVSPRSLLRMITDDSVVDFSIKSERLETLTNPKIEQGMIRAITLRKSIRQMGRLWRRPLLPMPEERLTDLYEWSRPAEEYDYFLSHTWETWGGLKYISLLMHSSHRFLLGCWLSAVVLCWCFCLLDLLPTFGHVNPEALDWWAEGEGCPTGPWIICSGFISVIVGLLLAPYLPDSCSRSDQCFMDAVCIHQADPEKKRQGIDAIAGFLSVSRQLRILWSPSYLSRLWCVFEIAAYRKVNSRGQVVLAPLFLERMVLLTLIFSYAIAGLLWTLGVQSYNDTIYALSLSPMLLLIHALRRNATGKTKLFEELDHFELTETHCSLNSDREFVLGAIETWYGSREAFTSYVRGPLRQELLQSATKVSTLYVLLMVTPAVSGMLEDHLALWKGGAPFHGVLTHFMGRVLGSYAFWIAFCVRMLISLCFFFAATRRWLILDYLLTCCIHLTVCAMAFAGDLAGRRVSRSSLWLTAGWMCFAAASLVVFTYLARKACKV
ncbi:unnamed protein product [Symbiodinium sp. CCMP2592]|nr:unnamed protein product [Symbiodinium sp. CCMP2592]